MTAILDIAFQLNFFKHISETEFVYVIKYKGRKVPVTLAHWKEQAPIMTQSSPRPID
jgi:hypothetical protein